MADRDVNGRGLVELDYYEGAFGPTVVITLTTRDSVGWLQGLFEDVAAAPIGAVVDLAGVPEVRAAKALRSLVLSRVSQSARKHLVRESADSLVWSCTSDEWSTISLMIEPFLSRSGHQYLTSEGVDDALVEVSYGEDRK